MTGVRAFRWAERGRHVLDVAVDDADRGRLGAELAVDQLRDWARERYGAIRPLPAARRLADAQATDDGCPVTVWDGPYSSQCSLGARVGVCAHHGRFRGDSNA